jgi:hypothetical protein
VEVHLAVALSDVEPVGVLPDQDAPALVKILVWPRDITQRNI